MGFASLSPSYRLQAESEGSVALYATNPMMLSVWLGWGSGVHRWVELRSTHPTAYHLDWGGYWRSRVAEKVISGKFSFMRFSSQLLRTR
jgi:hypothetical protein